MTLNPPEAVKVLLAYRHLVRRGAAGDPLAGHLSALFTEHLGKQPYPAFLTFWHLHLQAIPWDTARQAWGLTQTSQHL